MTRRGRAGWSRPSRPRRSKGESAPAVWTASWSPSSGRWPDRRPVLAGRGPRRRAGYGGSDRPRGLGEDPPERTTPPSGTWTWDPAHRMFSNVTSRPSAGQTPGVPSGRLGLPRPGSAAGAAEEADPSSATAARAAEGQTDLAASAFPSAAAGEPDPVLIAGD